MPTNRAIPSDPRRLGEQLAATYGLDRAVDPLQRVADRAIPPGPVEDALRGRWLGHPLHPLLTDLPIGFFTAANLLDLCGRRARTAADLMVAAGLATALPTAASGLADWRAQRKPEQRIGVVHAAANAAATLLYGLSLLARLRRHRFRGVLLAMAGAAAATVGGYLGGELVYRRGVGVDRPIDVTDRATATTQPVGADQAAAATAGL